MFVVCCFCCFVIVVIVVIVIVVVVVVVVVIVIVIVVIVVIVYYRCWSSISFLSNTSPIVNNFCMFCSNESVVTFMHTYVYICCFVLL